MEEASTAEEKAVGWTTRVAICTLCAVPWVQSRPNVCAESIFGLSGPLKGSAALAMDIVGHGLL